MPAYRQSANVYIVSQSDAADFWMFHSHTRGPKWWTQEHSRHNSELGQTLRPKQFMLTDEVTLTQAGVDKFNAKRLGMVVRTTSYSCTKPDCTCEVCHESVSNHGSTCPHGTRRRCGYRIVQQFTVGSCAEHEVVFTIKGTGGHVMSSEPCRRMLKAHEQPQHIRHEAKVEMDTYSLTPTHARSMMVLKRGVQVGRDLLRITNKERLLAGRGHQPVGKTGRVVEAMIKALRTDLSEQPECILFNPGSLATQALDNGVALGVCRTFTSVFVSPSASSHLEAMRDADHLGIVYLDGMSVRCVACCAHETMTGKHALTSNRDVVSDVTREGWLHLIISWPGGDCRVWNHNALRSGPIRINPPRKEYVYTSLAGWTANHGDAGHVLALALSDKEDTDTISAVMNSIAAMCPCEDQGCDHAWKLVEAADGFQVLRSCVHLTRPWRIELGDDQLAQRKSAMSRLGGYLGFVTAVFVY